MIKNQKKEKIICDIAQEYFFEELKSDILYFNKKIVTMVLMGNIFKSGGKSMTHEELILKAKEAKSVEELLVLAKENKMELTEESAKAYFEQMHKTGELEDDDLDNVAGGHCYHDGRKVVTVMEGCTGWTCKRCGGRKYVVSNSGLNRVHTCLDGGKVGALSDFNAICDTCEYCSYEKGLWLCNHPYAWK